MVETFTEYREISVTDPLRQGDVLEAAEAGSAMWRRHLLVITADCDFAHDKHRGRVTCVPLLTADEYLAEFHVPKLCEQQVRRSVDSLVDVLKTSGRPQVSRKRLREWASEEEASSIADLLQLGGAPRDTAIAAITSIRLVDAQASALKEKVDALVEAQLLMANGTKPEKTRNNVIAQLKQPYRSPPGDALFLSSIAPLHSLGYFAYLRHLEQIWQPDISIIAGHRDATYRRISRLRNTFRHAVAQRFAMVFMSIGLPDDYEDLRDLHSEMLGETLA